MTIPDAGSRWWSGDGKKFIVLATINQEEKIWVHYRDDNGSEESREYSCYLESFLRRFTELPS